MAATWPGSGRPHKLVRGWGVSGSVTHYTPSNLMWPSDLHKNTAQRAALEGFFMAEQLQLSHASTSVMQSTGCSGVRHTPTSLESSEGVLYTTALMFSGVMDHASLSDNLIDKSRFGACQENVTSDCIVPSAKFGRGGVDVFFRIWAWHLMLKYLEFLLLELTRYFGYFHAPNFLWTVWNGPLPLLTARPMKPDNSIWCRWTWLACLLSPDLNLIEHLCNELEWRQKAILSEDREAFLCLSLIILIILFLSYFLRAQEGVVLTSYDWHFNRSFLTVEQHGGHNYNEIIKY